MGLQKASSAFFETILETIRDPVFAKDESHRWIYVNPAFCQLIGRTKEELLGRSDFDYFPAKEAQVFWENDNLVFASGQSINSQVVLTNCHGVRHTMQTEKVPATMEDGTLVLIGVMRDASELHSLKEEKANGAWEANTKSEFMTNVTHELRTPLNGMLGLASLMAEGDLEDEQAELLSQIRSSGALLLSIINDILDESALASGKLKIYQSEFVIRDVLSETFQLVQNGMVEHENCFLLDVADDVPDRIIMDAKRLQQILINLLSNADKFTQEGKITLRVSTIDMDRPTALIVFAVTDTGCGISIFEQDSIFERFSQIDSTSTRKTTGSGLGLSIVNQLCTLMQGQVELESQLGQGSTFRVYLPLRVSTNTESTPQKGNEPMLTVPDESGNPHYVPVESDDKQPIDSHSLSILIAEDNPVNLMVIEKLLRREGYRADVVSDGMAAVSASRSNQYDLIFMDINMPKLDGIDASRIILSESSDIFICALTSNFGEEESRRFFRVGMKAHLTKPYTITELLTVLELCAETLPNR